MQLSSRATATCAKESAPCPAAGHYGHHAVNVVHAIPAIAADNVFAGRPPRPDQRPLAIPPLLTACAAVAEETVPAVGWTSESVTERTTDSDVHPTRGNKSVSDRNPNRQRGRRSFPRSRFGLRCSFRQPAARRRVRGRVYRAAKLPKFTFRSRFGGCWLSSPGGSAMADIASAGKGRAPPDLGLFSALHSALFAGELWRKHLAPGRVSVRNTVADPAPRVPRSELNARQDRAQRRYAGSILRVPPSAHGVCGIHSQEYLPHTRVPQ